MNSPFQTPAVLLPTVVDGCSLSPAALADQRNRATILRQAVSRLEYSSGELNVTFTPEAPLEILTELVAVERGCCPFLAIEYDEPERVLRVSAEESGREDAVDAIATFLAAET